MIVAGPEAEARLGNALPLANIPLGTTIHNIELVPGKGGQMVRTAGGSGPAPREGGRLRDSSDCPSGELRRVPLRCTATIGQVGNVEHANESLGKAGRARHWGFGRTIRGSR